MKAKKKLILKSPSLDDERTIQLWAEIMADWHMKNQALGICYIPQKRKK